jgi:hypothetical protein
VLLQGEGGRLVLFHVDLIAGGLHAVVGAVQGISSFQCSILIIHTRFLVMACRRTKESETSHNVFGYSVFRPAYGMALQAWNRHRCSGRCEVSVAVGRCSAS